MSGRRARIVGCGSALPRRVVDNAAMAETVETSDAWIVQRTGIRQRHIAGEGEKTSDLAIAASRAALARAGVEAEALDLVVLATTTPDNTFPATATRVQAALGMTRGCAFDIQAVCSGFVYALAMADNMLRLGQADRALVIGSETFTRILDWEDRGTCVLFGDGAGAVVLEATASNGATVERGILSTHLRSDGRLHDALYVDGGVSSTGTIGHVRMNGKDVFKHAVNNMAEAVLTAIETNDLTVEDIDWLVPHQANSRIIEALCRRLNFPIERVVVTVDRHANTSAASVPLALDEAVRDGRIEAGQLVLMEAMGGGFTWGSVLARW